MRMKKRFVFTPPKNPHKELYHIESFGGNYFGKYSKEKLYTPTRWQIMLNLYSTIVDQMLNPQMPHKWSTNDLHLQDLNLIRSNKPTWPLAFFNK